MRCYYHHQIIEPTFFFSGEMIYHQSNSVPQVEILFRVGSKLRCAGLILVSRRLSSPPRRTPRCYSPSGGRQKRTVVSPAPRSMIGRQGDAPELPCRPLPLVPYSSIPKVTRYRTRSPLDIYSSFLLSPLSPFSINSNSEIDSIWDSHSA